MRRPLALILPACLALAPVYAQTPSAQAPSAAASGARAGAVLRAQFTSAIHEREPSDALTRVTADNGQVYFFTELAGLAGQTVTHRWERDGQVLHEQKFEVGGPRWRVYSSKTLYPQQAGEWKVSVLDGAGATLAVSALSVDAAPAPAAPAPAPAAR